VKSLEFTELTLHSTVNRTEPFLGVGAQTSHIIAQPLQHFAMALKDLAMLLQDLAMLLQDLAMLLQDLAMLLCCCRISVRRLSAAL
jgi:hypothetical protein